MFSKRNQMKTYTPTGIRRFFFQLELLGKRRPDVLFDYSNLDPVVDTPPEKPQQRALNPHFFHKENVASGSGSLSTLPNDATRVVAPKPERVALINEDLSEDAVVITALDDIPFCCHEDLLTMPRDKLIDVAHSLNAKLPSAMAIDIDHVLPTSFIRSSIERIVGIRGEVPNAPKTLRLLGDSEEDRRLIAEFNMHAEMNKTPPTSPLAKRSQSHGHFTSLISPRLARLEEENEEEQDFGADKGEERQPKKRKLSFKAPDAESDSDVEMATDPEQTPTPLPRIKHTQFHHVAPSDSPTPARVLRSHSQKVDKSVGIDTAFIHNKSSMYRYQGRARRAKGEAKSSQVPSLIPKPIGGQRATGRLRPILSRRPSAATARQARASKAHRSCFSPRMDEDVPTPSTIVGTKRKRSGGRTESERQMTSEIERMNMGENARSDDMDIDL